MEVHHHSATPKGKEKHFKEYFKEFLMIFLAVFMGFIAENIRELLSDNSKEKEYITGLIQNFESDTVKLKFIIKATKQQISGLDSLRHVSKDKLSQLNVQDSLFRMTRQYLFYTINFEANDITLSQLRNAGGYRVIRKEGMLDSLAAYESIVHTMKEQYAATYSIFLKARDGAYALFDLNIGQKFRSNPTSTLVMITYDKEKVYGFYNGVWMSSSALQGY